MFSQRIRSVMEHAKLLIAPPETTVSKAAKLMAKKNVGAVMVVEAGRLSGIFTERDAVFRVIAQERDARHTEGHPPAWRYGGQQEKGGAKRARTCGLRFL